VTRQIAAVTPATIDHGVAGIPHDPKRGSGTTPADAQVVSQHAVCKIGTLLNAGTFGIVVDIGQGLCYQSIVGKAAAWPD